MLLGMVFCFLMPVRGRVKSVEEREDKGGDRDLVAECEECEKQNVVSRWTCGKKQYDVTSF